MRSEVDNLSQDRFVPELYDLSTSVSFHQVPCLLTHHQRYINNALKNIDRLEEPSSKPGKEDIYFYKSSEKSFIP